MACETAYVANGASLKSTDSQQVGCLLRQYGPALVLYARQWCRQPDDALQEALIDLLRTKPPPDNPPAWLFKTVRRKAMNLARAESRRVKHQQHAAVDGDSWFLEPHDQRMVVEEVETALTRLPSLEREIVVARIWGELTFEQIAEVVDQSASSVHRRFHNALEMMSELLGEASEK